MELRFTQSFENEYKKIVKGNKHLDQKISKQLHLFQTKINHPSLRLHKVESSEYWSISVDKSIRILMIIKKKWTYIYHIGKHEDVY